MIANKRWIMIGAAAALVLPLTSGGADKSQPFAPVADAVKARTGRELKWERDAVAREDNLRTIRALLKKPLNAVGASQIALLNNRDLQATFEEVGVSAADLREAGYWKNPSIDLTIRFPDRPPSATDAEEGVVFDFLDLIMIPLRKRVAADRLQAAQLRVADEALKLIAEVKTAVYTLQADSLLISRLKVVQETSGAALDLAQKQHEVGNIADLALAQQLANYSQSRLELAMAEAEMREHHEKINRLLSLWGADTDWKVSNQFPAMPDSDPPLNGLESLAVSQRLDLAAARSELSSVVRALGLTKTYRLIGALDIGIDTEHNPDHSNVTGPTLKLELPLFNQGQARIAKAEAELRRAERKFEGLAIEIRSEVRELRDRLGSKREVARFYQEELLPSRKSIVSQTQLHFNGMLLGNYELFTVKAEELRAEHGSVEALRDYWIARAELERSAGGSLVAGRTAEAKMIVELKPSGKKSKTHQH